MAVTIRGTVKEGLVVPGAPLPEGARVDIVVVDDPQDVRLELQAEFEAWHRASAEALDLVERLAREGEAGDAR